MILAQNAPSQSARKPRKGLRALGLVELPANGKAHLVPIAIMADDKFYDASAYKAAPVPIALYSDTVYEGERSGVSQGLFTVTGALQMKDTWIGEGTWLPAGAAPAKPRHTDTKPRLDDDEGPPRLRDEDQTDLLPRRTNRRQIRRMPSRPHHRLQQARQRPQHLRLVRHSPPRQKRAVPPATRMIRTGPR